MAKFYIRRPAGLVPMSILDAIITAFSWFWHVFLGWLSLFAAPIYNTELLWISIPIWANFIFAEFFQEKKGTSFGNAISNGAVPLFVGIDWARYITNSLGTQGYSDLWVLVLKYTICGIIMAYGLTIVIMGIQGHHLTRVIGRIREVTYVLLMFTPIIYGVVDPTLSFFFGVIAFFIVWYGVVEYFDWLIPDPKAMTLDSEEKTRPVAQMRPQVQPGPQVQPNRIVRQQYPQRWPPWH
jgi:hypothetical protein